MLVDPIKGIVTFTLAEWEAEKDWWKEHGRIEEKHRILDIVNSLEHKSMTHHEKCLENHLFADAMREKIKIEKTDFRWELGGDTDCDLCGMSYNEIGLELWDEVDIWQLWMRTGCYGGYSVMSDSVIWKEEVEDIIQSALQFPEFTEENANELRAKIALIKGENK